MRNYTNSDYALNKFSGGIVYRFNNEIIEVTLADYLTENPTKTEADFFELKEISDSIYHDQVRSENAQTKKNTPFDLLDETFLTYSSSPEDLYIDEIDAHEDVQKRVRQLEASRRVLDKLTDVQRRRFLLHRVEGMTTREIAVLEGVQHPSVVESLTSAEKKIKKVLVNEKNTLPKQPSKCIG